MIDIQSSDVGGLFKSLGLPDLTVHHAFGHFDFTKASRRILVIGPMGSGKTEFSARVWRDSKVATKKSDSVARKTTRGRADRRRVFFVRSMLDAQRFADYPEDALAYRGGYERLGEYTARIRDSFELENLLADHPECGTWILDEASFYDERIAYVVSREAAENGRTFIFPTLILNFRKDIFNSTARLLLETASDVYPLTAYCEHEDCLEDSFYTYRYYKVDGQECPALFFDPLIIVGGDRRADDPYQPNYETRCDRHHFLPGKEYTYLILKPLGLAAAQGNMEPLAGELRALKYDVQASALAGHFREKYSGQSEAAAISGNALKVPGIAEKALVFLFAEQNLISEVQLKQLAEGLALDKAYLFSSLADNGRLVNF